jgi:hypothetical protein
MRSFVLVFVFSFISCAVLAQRHCQTYEYHTSGQNKFQDLNFDHSFFSRDTLTDELITIPVVIHVLYNAPDQNISTAQILSQLSALNEDFRRKNTDAVQTPSAFLSVAADTRIEFCLAKTDPKGKPTNGIVRKSTNKTAFTMDDAVKFSAAGGDDAWDSRKYLNIWVANLQGNAIGYATSPGGEMDKDGVVIHYQVFGTVGNLRPAFNKGRTATHEIGHWLGLRHIWGDQTCGDDGIGDTPKQEFYNSNCPSFPKRSNCSPDNNGDMFMNFMDYSNDACMNLFTVGQKKRMRTMFAEAGPRNSFLLSNACNAIEGEAPTPPTEEPPVSLAPKPSVRIYPNPTRAGFKMQPVENYNWSKQTIRILDVQGRTWLKAIWTNEIAEIGTQQLPAGVYFVEIGSGQQRLIQKLVKLP